VTLYTVLFLLTLLAAGFVVTGEVLGASLQHRAVLGDYLAIAWLASSMATIGGALGSDQAPG
jgi:hypothetical protein